MRFFFSLFLLLLPSLCALDKDWIPAECWNNNSTKFDPLACWLQHLHVHIPDQTFPVLSFLTVELRDLVCTNFSVGDLTATSSFSSGDDQEGKNQTLPGLELNVQNVSASCRGSYRATGGLSGQVYAQLEGEDHALDWQVALLDNASEPSQIVSRRPRTLRTTSCEIHAQLSELLFSGSISADLVNLLAPTLSSYISKTLREQICPLCSDTVDPWVTDQLTRWNKWIDNFLSNNAFDNYNIENEASYRGGQTQHYHPKQSAATFQRRLEKARETSNQNSNNNNVVDWQYDVPVLRETLDLVNQQVLRAEFLNHGLLPHQWSNDNEASCGLFFDGWNGVIRDLVVEEYPQGVPLLVNLTNVSWLVPGYALLNFDVPNVSITSGLDEWDWIQLFQIVSASESDEAQKRDGQFHSVLQAHNWTIRVYLQLTVEPIPDGVFLGDDLEEDFYVDIHLSDWKFDTNLSVAYTQIALHNLTMSDSILPLVQGLVEQNASIRQAALNSLASGILGAQLANLELDSSLTSIVFTPVHPTEANSTESSFLFSNVVESNVLATRNGMQQNHILEDDLDDVINCVLDFALTEYAELVQHVTAAAVRGPGRDTLNQLLNDTISSSSTVSSTSLEDHVLNVTLLLTRLNEYLGQNKTVDRLNHYLNCLGEFLGSAVETLVWNTSTLSALMELEAFEIQYLGSIRNLTVLEPQTKDKALLTVVHYGRRNNWDPSRINTSARLWLAPIDTVAHVELESSIDDLAITLSTMVTYATDELRHMSLWQVLQRGQCVLAPAAVTFDSPSVSLGLLQSKLQVTLNNPAWNDTIKIQVDSHDYPVVQSKASTILGWIVQSAQDFLADFLTYLLNTAPYTCQGLPSPRHDDSGPDDIHYSSIFLIIGAVLLFAQPAVFLLRTPSPDEDTRQQYRSHRLHEPLLNDPNVLYANEAEVEEPDEEQFTSLMFSTSTSNLAKVLVPSLLLIAICLLLSSNLNVGATVDMVVTLDKTVVHTPPLFGFSLYNTAKEMFQAGIYPLFFLVVVLSGVWPYIKLLLMMLAWVAKVNHLPQRGSLLLRLDAWSKFSLVDTYVLVLMVVAFRYHLDLTPRQSDVDPAVVALFDVYIQPQFGFYGFLVATSMSLLAGHLLVFLHRRAEWDEGAAMAQLTSGSERLVDHIFVIGNRRLQLSPTGIFFLGVMALMTGVLLCIGMIQESFVFDIGGLAGAMLGDQHLAVYSLWSLGTSLSTSVEDPDDTGILFLQGVYYFYAVATPMSCLVLLLVLLYVPLRAGCQLWVLSLAEIANAWSAVEVFVLSIFAALFEISTFASFIVGDNCDFLQHILKDQGRDDTCFTVTASVRWSGAYLFLGVLLNVMWVSMVQHLAHAAVQERVAVALSESPLIVWWGHWMLVEVSRTEEEDDDGYLEGDGNEQISVQAMIRDGELFQEEWRNRAEQDPAWKEWKEAESPQRAK